MRKSKPLAESKIYVAGHTGMVGSAILRALPKHSDLVVRTSSELDLRRQDETLDFFHQEKPDVVFFAAGRVGGIHANNTCPVEFLSDNMQMSMNSIRAAFESQTQRFLYLGSTCIYPHSAPQPIRESALLTSVLEETNEGYALAKIAGLKLCQYYRRQHGVLFHSAMPANLYGPGDNYHPDRSHVLAALLRRFHEAKIEEKQSVTVWGTGTPRREFLHVEDLAKALVKLVQLPDPADWVNVGTGVDISISDLAKMIADVVGFEGTLTTDPLMPDGPPQKLADGSLMHSYGWQAEIDIRQGIESTYKSFLTEHYDYYAGK